MDFIPGIDGPSEGVPRVLACFSNVCSFDLLVSCFGFWFSLWLFALMNDCLLFSDFAESPTPWATEACGWWPIPKNFYIHQRCDRSSSFDDCTTFLCFSLILNPKFCVQYTYLNCVLFCSGKPSEGQWPYLQCGQPQQWSNSEAARRNDDRGGGRILWFKFLLFFSFCWMK